MTVLEIIDFDAQQQNLNLRKSNAKILAQRIKDDQVRLNIKKAQQKLIQAKKPAISVTP